MIVDFRFFSCASWVPSHQSLPRKPYASRQHLLNPSVELATGANLELRFFGSESQVRVGFFGSRRQLYSKSCRAGAMTPPRILRDVLGVNREIF